MISPIQFIRITQYDNLYAGMDDGQDKYLSIAGFDGGTGLLPYFVNVFKKGCFLFQFTDGTWFRNTANDGLTPVWSPLATSDLVVSGTLTPSEINTLFSGPTNILPTSGPGFGYLCTFYKFKYNFNTTPYTLAGSTTLIQLKSGASLFANIQANGFITLSADAVQATMVGGIVGFRIGDNLPLTISCTIGDPSLGDGTIDYEIHFVYVATT